MRLINTFQTTKVQTPDDVDSLIGAQIPDKETEPLLYELVALYMTHGPCGPENPHSPCMVNGVSIKQPTIITILHCINWKQISLKITSGQRDFTHVAY